MLEKLKILDIAVLIFAIATLSILICNSTYKIENKINIGKDTVYNVITVHDTITIKPDTVKIVTKVTKTIHDTIVKFDSISCYSFDVHPSDGAYIKAEVCSNAFKALPSDITGNITYVAPPDTGKIIYRTDTLTTIEPFYTNWKFYVGFTASFLLGAILFDE